jgi:hypothetical protein
LVWFILNLIQAACTEVTSDEAYYSLFAKNLSWGYFDHPPMIALLVKISSMVFSSVLGIRFITVILQLITLYIMWKTIGYKEDEREEVFLFFLVSSSMVIFAVFGFIATPDAPLLFFAALFLYAYKRFLENETWKYGLILSFCLAGLIYSKYQSFLLIGIVVITNFRLLKSVKFLSALFLAFLLLAPHIFWQISNNFPGIRYHLVDRASGFCIKNVIEYLPVQFAVFNPFILGASIYIMVRNRPADLFTKALYGIIVWVLLFFGSASFRGHVEPHWTALCSIPLIILIGMHSGNQSLKRFLFRSLIPSLVIIIVARVLVLTDIKVVRNLGLNGKKKKFEFIESVAKDLPVVFPGSYPYPALYTFFTGKEAFAVNSFSSRMTQYDIWQKERIYNNKPVFVCGFGEGDSRLYRKDDIEFYGYRADSLQTVNRMHISFEPRKHVLTTGDTVDLTVSITNPYTYDIDFNHKDFPVMVYIGFIGNGFKDYFPMELNEPVGIIRAGEKVVRKASAMIPDIKPGRYNSGVCLITLTGAAINNSFYRVIVKPKSSLGN